MMIFMNVTVKLWSEMYNIEVRLYRGRGPIAKLIQWQTRSPYSHAAILINGEMIDAREGYGCRLRVENDEDRAADRFVLYKPLRGAAQTMMYKFLLKQVDKDYDYTMVARFISRRQATRSTSQKWFCSELVFAAFQQAGINLLERVDPWAVSPGLLSMSPLLRKV